MTEIATVEPTKIIAGDYIQWKIPEDSDRTIADGWVLTYSFVMTGAQFAVTCTDSGDNHHLATISVATSTAFTAGTYKWQSYITKGTERYYVNSGSLVIEPNFASLTTGYDARTFWRTVLDNVQAVIEGRATKDQSSYTVNGRQLSRTPVADLLLLYNEAKMHVSGEESQENLNKGLDSGNTIKLRFTR